MSFEVIHAGYPGDNTRAMLKRLERDVLNHHPSAVTVQCGTNDAINPRAYVPLDEFERNLREIIGKIRSAGAETLLIAPPPCLPDEVILRYQFDIPAGTDLNIPLKQYAEKIVSVAADLKIPFLDLFTLFEDLKAVGSGKESLIRNKANSSVEDGAHPTEAGYKLIGRQLYAKLKEEDFDCSRLVCFGDSMTFGYPYAGMGTLDGINFPAVVFSLLNK